jgi:ubiquinone/menaquinone biosynthesis C-methylase UbiE/uncharacterized damage-inducible protein DinB
MSMAMPTKDDRWIAGAGPVAAAMRFAMGVPGQILVNTAAFRLPEELRIESTWTVLDVGCGRAGLARVVSHRAQLEQPPVAVDPSGQMLALGAKDSVGDGTAEVRLVQGDIADLPLGNDLFNFVYSGHAFKYLNDEQLTKCLVEVRRVMKPGALFLAWEFAPTKSELLDRWNRFVLQAGVPFERLRGYRELRSMAYDAGFDWVQAANLRPFLLPPIPRVSLIMGKAPQGWRSTIFEGRRVMEPMEGLTVAGRVETLAAKFMAVNDDVIATVEAASDEQWKATCADEGWTVGVVAHHIGEGYPLITALIQALGSGTDVPSWTLDKIDQSNKDHAIKFASVAKAETLKALRSGGSAAVSVVRSLSDEQLDRRAEVLPGAPALTAEHVIANSLIGSTISHLKSMKKAI